MSLSNVTALRDRLMEILRHHFKPEFLNRVDEVVVFRALGKEQIRRIVDLQLQRVQRTAAAQNGGVNAAGCTRLQRHFSRNHLVAIAPDPRFARFDGTHQWVTRRMIMRARMAIGR